MQAHTAVPTRGVVRRWMFGACVTVLLPVLVLGWVFPEHRDIAVLAVHQLPRASKRRYKVLWTEARAGHEVRLCAEAANANARSEADCIDYAAWTAIAGDHSCSAARYASYRP